MVHMCFMEPLPYIRTFTLLQDCHQSISDWKGLKCMMHMVHKCFMEPLPSITRTFPLLQDIKGVVSEDNF
jgi:hypothetical protein